MKSILNIVKMLMAIFLTLIYLGCGGGGGGGDGAGASGIQYTGLTTQATIDANNAEQLAVGAYTGGDIGIVMGSRAFAQAEEREIDHSRALSVSEAIEKSVLHIEVTVSMGGPALKAIITDSGTIIGNCGGIAFYTINLNDVTGEFTGTFNFNNYCEDDLTLSGNSSISGTFDPVTEEFIQLSMSFESLHFTAVGDSFTVKGGITYDDIQATTVNVDMDLLMRDNSTGKVYWAQNYYLRILKGQYYTDVSILGRYYDPDCGYVDVETTTNLRTYDDIYSSPKGVLVVEGDTGNFGGSTMARLVVHCSAGYYVEADIDGNGSCEWESEISDWSEVVETIWTATSTVNPPEGRYDHSAVWTGAEMIVWGGNLGNSIATDTGGRFDPFCNIWTTMSTDQAPSARYLHTAVWTGTEMIIWGGLTLITPGQFETLNSGVRYDPQKDSWTQMNTNGAPSARSGHTAVWTGTEMIVWGGSCFHCPAFDTGARYNPTTDTWTPVSTIAAPSARTNHTAVWTGSQMIVWGGEDDVDLTDTGGLYDPILDSWAATDASGAPSPRRYHVAAWTGTSMIVFGGTDLSPTTSLITGGLYDPTSDSWAATNTGGVPSFYYYAYYHPAVWSGTELITWSKSSQNLAMNKGARYNPVTDSWTSICTSDQPSRREKHTLVWTGSQMIVWGGDKEVSSTGGIYDPSVDPKLCP